MRHGHSILAFTAIALGMGAAMTSALGDPAVGFSVGIGTAFAISGRTLGRCFGKHRA
jgi:hypothetical protein